MSRIFKSRVSNGSKTVEVSVLLLESVDPDGLANLLPDDAAFNVFEVLQPGVWKGKRLIRAFDSFSLREAWYSWDGEVVRQATDFEELVGETMPFWVV